jgi:hypothetical protein
MEVINKPKINYTKKSLQFFFHDRRKVISAVAILSLPFLNQLWRLAPEGIEISYYDSFDAFVWNFCLNLMFVVISVAWYFSVPKKDQVLQFLSLLSAGYGIYLTFETLPFADKTPLWMDIGSSAMIFAVLYFCLQYIQKNYLSKPNDYKALHDGLVYDLHHQRFLGSINRIAGLLEIAEMDEPYKCLCSQEIDELKESIAYIAEKYESLN